jgi:hypothetical protein
LTSMVKN